MLKVALVRGKYLNNFEGQNYVFPEDRISLTAISSFQPLHKKFPFPVIRLPSLADLGRLGVLERLVKILSNRILGDSQILFGLEKYASKFDIFHTADPHYYYSYQLACLRAKNLIKKLIVTSWETIPFNNEGTRQKAEIKKFTRKNVDMFVCYTNKAKQALIKEGVNPDKIKVIRLGVDINKFFPKLTKLSGRIKMSKKDFVILFVGRLVEEKGINDLYEAFKQIQSSKSKIQNYQLKLKIVSGQINYEDMPKVYQEADIFVLPSKKSNTWKEQYGMVLVEAMACGLPVVAYDSGAISEVLGGVGLLVKEGNIDGLAASITRLIENKNLRIKLGKMGRSRAEKEFDSRMTAKKIQKIYENFGSGTNKK